MWHMTSIAWGSVIYRAIELASSASCRQRRAASWSDGIWPLPQLSVAPNGLVTFDAKQMFQAGANFSHFFLNRLGRGGSLADYALHCAQERLALASSNTPRLLR